jgi:hypothetical protein
MGNIQDKTLFINSLRKKNPRKTSMKSRGKVSNKSKSRFRAEGASRRARSTRSPCAQH